MLGGAGAEIAVDTETGRIEVTKLVNVADVGRAINPASVDRQLTGAAIMQLGFTLFEEMIFSDGQVVNASLADYKIPGFLDVPADIFGRVRRGAAQQRPVRRERGRRDRRVQSVARDRQCALRRARDRGQGSAADAGASAAGRFARQDGRPIEDE